MKMTYLVPMIEIFEDILNFKTIFQNHLSQNISEPAFYPTKTYNDTEYVLQWNSNGLHEITLPKSIWNKLFTGWINLKMNSIKSILELKDDSKLNLTWIAIDSSIRFCWEAVDEKSVQLDSSN